MGLLRAFGQASLFFSGLVLMAAGGLSWFWSRDDRYIGMVIVGFVIILMFAAWLAQR